MATIGKEEILDAISAMSVMDVVDLVKMMEEKFNVTAASAAVAVAAPAAGAAGGAEAAAAEQTEFNVELSSFGDSKLAVVKVVRTITGLGLKEAKELVEKAPSVIKEGISKEDAEDVKKQLEEAGATAEIK